MTAKTMAEVLAEHHLANALSAAGYGLVADAQREAWAEGHRTCRLDPDSIEFNPYRREAQ